MKIQEHLNHGQATPVVGPIFVSPLKVLVSLAEIIAGLAGAILFGGAHHFTSSDNVRTLNSRSVELLKSGFVNLIYSVFNMVTLGSFGLAVERKWIHIHSNIS